MTRNIVLIACTAVLLSSCYSSRKAKINEIVIKTSLQQDKELQAIKSINANKADKLSLGKIDSVINKTIDKRLDKSKSSIDSIKIIMNELTTSAANRKSLRKTYKSIIKSKIVFLRNNSLSFEQRILNYGFIEDVLNNSNETQFDLATFFGPGEFLIPAEKMEDAKKSFSPVVDSILKFAGKYTSIQKYGTIVLKGFADATGIKTGSPLYIRLSNELKQDNPSNADLNLALSKLRTESISGVINEILKSKEAALLSVQIIHFELVQEGHGEQKPNPSITDYTENDNRRRIVLFFWSLLPK